MITPQDCLALLKSNLNLTENVRDEYLTAILAATIQELEGVDGLTLSGLDYNHCLLVADLAGWNYRARSTPELSESLAGIPIYIQTRINSLILDQQAGTLQNVQQSDNIDTTELQP